MCYFASVNASKQKIAKRYNAKIVGEDESFVEKPIVSAFDFEKLPIITGAEKTLQFLNWGLIPQWLSGKDAEIEKSLTFGLNARAETIFEKPFFKEAINRNTAIFPCTGFFEWEHKTNGIKQPWFIKSTEDEIFSIAAIFEQFTYKNRLRQGFSLITVEANNKMAKVHNTKKRMPLVIPKGKESKWLSANSTKEKQYFLQNPLLEENWEMWPINPNFKHELNLKHPIPSKFIPPEQLSLF
jgi:putative SOS response-associated peptidase YedK